MDRRHTNEGPRKGRCHYYPGVHDNRSSGTVSQRMPPNPTDRTCAGCGARVIRPGSQAARGETFCTVPCMRRARAARKEARGVTTVVALVLAGALTGCGAFWGLSPNDLTTVHSPKIAASPDWVVAVANHGIRIYQRNAVTGDVVPGRANTDPGMPADRAWTQWLPFSALLPNCYSDPQVVWDPMTRRWFMSAIGWSSNELGWWCLAVSHTEVPVTLAGWSTWGFFGPPVSVNGRWTASSFPDWDNLGVGVESIVLTARPFVENPYGPGGTIADVEQSAVLVVNKADLVLAPHRPPRYQVFTGPVMPRGFPPAGHFYNLAPSVIQTTFRDPQAAYDVYLPGINEYDVNPRRIRMYGVRGAPPTAEFHWLADYVLPLGSAIRPSPRLPQLGAVPGDLTPGKFWRPFNDWLMHTNVKGHHMQTIAQQGCFPHAKETNGGSCIRYLAFDLNYNPPRFIRDDLIGAKGEYYSHPAMTFTLSGDTVIGALHTNWGVHPGVVAFGMDDAFLHSPVKGPIQIWRGVQPHHGHPNDAALWGYFGWRWADWGGATFDYRTLHGAFLTQQVMRPDHDSAAQLILPLQDSLVKDFIR